MLPLIEQSNNASLSLRSVLSHNNWLNQGLDPHLLPSSLSNKTIPNTMLVCDDILRSKFVCVRCGNDLSMSSALVRLEQKPSRWEMHRLQFCNLGQWRYQHSSRPVHYRSPNLRSSEVATWAKEENWTLHYVWSRKLVSCRFHSSEILRLTSAIQCMCNLHGTTLHYQDFRSHCRCNVG